MNSAEALDLVINHIGYIMNSLQPVDEINKMIALEITTNPELCTAEYKEVMTRVIAKLAEFYKDNELEVLWHEYLMLEELESFGQVG